MIEWSLVTSLLSLAGAVFFFASAVGLWRLPDFYTRLHAPTKAATLGVLLLAAGSFGSHLGSGGALWLEDLLIMAFIALTVPVGAQVLSRAATRRGLEPTPGTAGEPPARKRGARR